MKVFEKFVVAAATCVLLKEFYDYAYNKGYSDGNSDGYSDGYSDGKEFRDYNAKKIQEKKKKTPKMFNLGDWAITLQKAN